MILAMVFDGIGNFSNLFAPCFLLLTLKEKKLSLFDFGNVFLFYDLLLYDTKFLFTGIFLIIYLFNRMYLQKIKNPIIHQNILLFSYFFLFGIIKKQIHFLWYPKVIRSILLINLFCILKQPTKE